MPFNVNDFRAQLVGQGARPNLFEVTIPFPDAIAREVGQKMTFMCKASQLPGGEIGTVEVPYFGRTIKLAGNRTFAEWSTTVINDEDFIIHSGMVNWMNLINSHAANLQTLPNQDYQADATVRQFTKDGLVAKEVKIINCWPSSLGQIDLAWDSNDAIEEFEVTWQFDYWTIDDAQVETGAE